MTNSNKEIKRLEQAVSASMQISEVTASVSFSVGDTREINQRVMAITAAIEETTSAIDEIARATDSTVESASSSQQKSDACIQNLDVAKATMSGAREQASDGLNQAQQLEAYSEEIGEFAETIAKIAGQTKLLSLNANIEAARAGDAGRGFAIVATEVKSLSQETSSAATRIANRIQQISADLKEMVVQMQGVQNAIETGEKELDTANEAMNDVQEGVNNVAEQAKFIASSISEQSTAMTEVSGSAEKIAALADQAAGHSESALESVSGTEQIISNQFAELDAIELETKVLYRAQSDHYLWKKRLAEILAGRAALNMAELTDCHQCRLGKWYDSAAKDPRYADNPNFQALAKPHQQVHELGKQAAALYAEKRRAEAFDFYQQVEVASSEVVRLLKSLLNDIQEPITV